LKEIQTTHDNHFVPQWYLKQWADTSGLVWSYRLLVSHSSVPTWQQNRPRGIAFRRDLYTSVRGDTESDEFEKWVEREFEAPAQTALQRVLNGQNLQPHHWQDLGKYALCQQLRTPQDFLESKERWKQTLPEIMNQTLQKATRLAEEHHQKGEPLPQPTSRRGKHLRDAFKITVRPNARPETKEGEIKVTLLMGRELWLQQQRHLLDGVGQIAAKHSWSIVEPAGDAVWFTSDQPVVRMNYREDGIDLKGGWGKARGNILMPLSPHHLLFTEIGEDLPPQIRFNEEQTSEILGALALRAHRMIFADHRLRLVEQLRPRIVDSEAFKQEEEDWAGWHRNQTMAQHEHDNG
jgi:hypothetical protein